MRQDLGTKKWCLLVAVPVLVKMDTNRDNRISREGELQLILMRHVKETQITNHPLTMKLKVSVIKLS